LVQQAVTAFVQSKAKGPAYAEGPPPGTDSTIKYLRDVYAEEARQHSDRGYRAGLAYLNANRLPWSEFQGLAQNDFDLKRWLDPWHDGFVEAAMHPEVGREPHIPDWMVALMKADYLGEFANPISGDGFYPDGTYLQGFSRALRDVWNAVEHGIKPVRPPGTGPENPEL